MKTTRCLGCIGPGAEAAVPALTRLLEGEHQEVRIAAAHCLSRIGPAAAPSVPALVAAMKRPDAPLDLWSGANYLGEIGPGAGSAAPFLAYLMANGSNSSLRVCAEAALVRMNERPLQAFCDRLQDTSDPADWWERAVSVRRQFPSNAATAIPYLIAGLTQTNLKIQGIALEILGEIHIKPDLCVPAIAAYIRSPASTNLDGPIPMREDALEALAEFGNAAKSSVPEILECLRDPNERVRSRASLSLRKIDPDAAAQSGIQ